MPRGCKLPDHGKGGPAHRVGPPGVNPYAAGSATLQKSGSLKPGTNTATAKGKPARLEVSGGAREAIPASP
jgi:hypothetical protein